jgi:ABC-type transporter Mla subunit MlaD
MGRKRLLLELIDEKLSRVLLTLDAIDREVAKMSQELDRLTQEVEKISGVVDSAEAAFVGLADEIRSLKNDPAALQALADKIDNKANQLAQAVAANSPQPPRPSPQPPQPNPQP